ncbi:phospholipid:diacylglycerol acyltransferase [Nematocida homosporus]|uniref:phospholipid:diacylglycerol acyltransferase n=1 Tax=Nematocida homosporus TaxID=1912981 RepID=UPI0022211CE9|nr:phospholipid:diacylglycerol acyltransferase [Nematocida homosporus]KAI5184598.1 phospholipid:diacylglycerol acyltransferase [Nematocida homosporus]
MTQDRKPRQNGNKCAECGRDLSKGKKRRYFLMAVLLIIFGIVLKKIYERKFPKTIAIGLMDDFLKLSAISNLNLSKSTKAKLLYLAEIAASSEQRVDEELPGMIAAKNGQKRKHPVTIIPGIANSNLELWKTSKESNSFFRKKIWGSHSTLTFMLHNRSEWFNSMRLDEETGMDPDGIKVRATPGLESSDFSIPGLWFWWKIVENLSHIEYDVSAVHFAAFDWRLGMDELEERDSYFTRLKVDIEHQFIISKEKSLIVAHSLGSLVFHYFMQWVTEKDKTWVDRYIHAIAYIGPPLLGAPKAACCLLTGDALDTAEMGVVQYSIAELLFGRAQRKELFKTWGSALSLLPKGGEEFWEGDQPVDGSSQSTIISTIEQDPAHKEKLPLPQAFELIKETLGTHNQKYLERIINPTCSQDTWINPLLSPLPHAPNLRIYSLYGIGKPTERAYILEKTQSAPLLLHRTQSCEKQRIYRGICTVDGDGTVPLLSAGYMGYAGWKSNKLNPSRIKTINKEYTHTPATAILEVRGGPKTAQHVNILGNHELISDLLLLASGGTIEERIVSDLPTITNRLSERQAQK